jgi:hypothetical protein
MLVDIMRIKLKNLREVSEIIDNSIINAYVNELKRGDMHEMIEFSKINLIKERMKEMTKEQEQPNRFMRAVSPAPLAHANANTYQVQVQPSPSQPLAFRRSQQVALKLANPIQTYSELHADNNNNNHYVNVSNSNSEVESSFVVEEDGAGVVRGTCV